MAGDIARNPEIGAEGGLQRGRGGGRVRVTHKCELSRNGGGFNKPLEAAPAPKTDSNPDSGGDGW